MRYKPLLLIFLLIIMVVASVLLFINGLYLYFSLGVLIVLIDAVALLRDYNKHNEKFSYMLSAVENEDYSFRFYEMGAGYYNKIFNTTLNKIKNIMLKEKQNTRDNERYLELLLENVITGIVSINKRGDVVNCNSRALELIGLTVFTHISQLKKVNDQLYEVFQYSNKESSGSFAIYTEKEKIELTMKFSWATIKGEQLKIISMNDIAKELEEREMESWSRLIRVLTHEIMNTVTPIASLSDTLSMLAKEIPTTDKKSDELTGELNYGLGVISSMSKGLISFVDSYRNLTKIPVPDKKIINVKDMLNRVLTLMREELEEQSVQYSLDIQDEQIMLFADENLISQVIINIIRNAIQAMKGYALHPELNISVNVDELSEDVYVAIKNNGKMISKSDQENIFVPFFTTKQTGTGIGLSLSRQIMRLHDGYLKLLLSDQTGTVFLLQFR